MASAPIRHLYTGSLSPRIFDACGRLAGIWRCGYRAFCLPGLNDTAWLQWSTNVLLGKCRSGWPDYGHLKLATSAMAFVKVFNLVLGRNQFLVLSPTLDGLYVARNGDDGLLYCTPWMVEGHELLCHICTDINPLDRGF